MLDHVDGLGLAAHEHLAAELGPCHDARPDLADRLEPLELESQGRRHLGAARLLVFAGLGQQQARLHIGEPRRHHEIVGGELELLAGHLRDELKILVGELEDRDLRQVDLLVARQDEQQVERPFIAFEVEHQPVFRLGLDDVDFFRVVPAHIPNSIPVSTSMIGAPVSVSMTRSANSTTGRITQRYGLIS